MVWIHKIWKWLFRPSLATNCHRKFLGLYSITVLIILFVVYINWWRKINWLFHMKTWNLRYLLTSQGFGIDWMFVVLQMYPEGAWFLYFKGRLELMRGNLNESVSWYIKSWKSQSVWPQFHHLCFWELMWAHR